MRAWCFLLILAAGCRDSTAGGDDDGTPTPTGNGTVFDPAITNVTLEIDYETGQEPYTGPILGFGDTFDLTATNLDRVFAGTKTLTIPRTLGEMQDIGTIADEELTTEDLLAIADAHRDRANTATERTYYLVFVSGHFADASGVQEGVLGVSLGTTGVIAMFKDTIRSTDVPGLPNVVRYVEQSTIVHEGAHAIGLVANGVPMVSVHQDTEHGAHCNNDRCVMYYLNEGAADAAAFVQQQVLTGNTILFDASCLADVDALTGGP
ncbi:MAG TPA: hypothetical protein VFQ53_42805 [Kofleriaceae bacterium]|nr:hypothetical protein [Kofleriaceae bacterium]